MMTLAVLYPAQHNTEPLSSQFWESIFLINSATHDQEHEISNLCFGTTPLWRRLCLQETGWEEAVCLTFSVLSQVRPKLVKWALDQELRVTPVNQLCVFSWTYHWGYRANETSLRGSEFFSFLSTLRWVGKLIYKLTGIYLSNWQNIPKFFL